VETGIIPVRRKVHETIAKVSDDYGRRQTFNTAIAAVMELCNELSKLPEGEGQSLSVEREALLSSVLMLAPIVPHITHQLWSDLGQSGDILDADWPTVDESALVRSSITIVVQVNGKVRGRMDVAPDTDREALENFALAQDNVARFLEDKTIRKVIVVPGKLVNIVAN
jgi:leucyl-tRNA synthetase